MSDDLLKSRAKSLENAFFAKRDQEMLAAMRRAMAEEARVAELQAATGIDDVDVLKKLHELDIGPETLLALALVPVIEVAWADGTLDDRERAAVLKAAVEEGVDTEGPAHALLTAWLAERPGADLRAAWFAYVRAFCRRLDEEARKKFQRTLLGHVQSVAEATGGFLGLGNRISPAEQQVLDDLRGAFETD